MVDLINDFDHIRVWIAEEGAVRLLLGLGLRCEEKISEEGWTGWIWKKTLEFHLFRREKEYIMVINQIQTKNRLSSPCYTTKWI